ncbi:HD domain-containing protein [Lentibacillus salicampi]|uniref:HD domain-containing protein n=1 Tax=Lentibacillus salicampi TaxID=175306 RepID=A0A4Y9AD81_9BACI|nr:HD domain-containing protein [Lentibacillus salicampi]TFJ93849.1 HD domain-containing protein [Lentibacillus salicampi]
MNISEKTTAISHYVYRIFNDDASGHDFFHMKRVALMAKDIAIREQADSFVCEAAGWIHDVGDRKLFSDREQALSALDHFLQSIHCTPDEISEIQAASEDISFSKGNIPTTLEGKIVQDADRLDAIGAVGIARTFAYGAVNGQLLWHDSDNNRQHTSIQHFYDKLLRLKDAMNTATGKQVAAKRHQIMESYLQQFFMEWR